MLVDEVELRGKRVESLLLEAVSCVIRNYVELLEAKSNLDVLREGRKVREARAIVDVLAEGLQSLLIEDIASTATIEDEWLSGSRVDLESVRVETIAKEDTVRILLVLDDLVGVEVGAEVLDDVEHIVSTDEEVVEGGAELVVDELPDALGLLPHVIIGFRTLVVDRVGEVERI